MHTRERKFHLAGWILFLVCALCFIASAAASGDPLYLAGSVFFFVACIAFVIPLVTRPRVSPGRTALDERNTDSEPSA